MAQTKILKMKIVIDLSYLEGALHYSYKKWQGTKSKRDWNAYSQFSLVATGLGMSASHIWKASWGKCGVWDSKQIQEFSMVVNKIMHEIPNQPSWSAFYKPQSIN